MMLAVYVIEIIHERVLQYENREIYGAFREKAGRGAKAEALRLYLVHGRINITVRAMAGAATSSWQRSSAASSELALVEILNKSTI